MWCEWEGVSREGRDVSSSTTSATLITSFVVSSVGVSFPSLARNVFLLLAFLLITDGQSLTCSLIFPLCVSSKSSMADVAVDGVLLCLWWVKSRQLQYMIMI